MFFKIICILLLIAVFVGIIAFAFKMHQLSKLKKMNFDDIINYVTKDDDNIKISIAIIKEGKINVHLSDNDSLDDRHWLPGKGIVDFKSIVDTIRKTSCSSLSMEVFPSNEEKHLSPSEFLKLAYTSNRKLRE